jgi:hypothetical protein
MARRYVLRTTTRTNTSCVVCTFAPALTFARTFALTHPTLLHAQGGTAQTIPVRQLSPLVATDSGAIGSVLGVRHLADGRVLVNDAARLRLIVFDSTLSQRTVIADTSGAPHRYGLQQGIFVPWLGDSTLFYDQQARAFVVIDPHGHLGRSIAPMRDSDVLWLMSGWNGAQGHDPAGHLVLRVPRSAPVTPPGAAPAAPRDSGVRTITVRRDSLAIVRVHPETRIADTVALVGRPFTKSVSISLGRGGTMGYTATNPLPQTDEWALLPDGTVAVVRGIDYHIDWYHPDGSMTSTPRMPFDWRRVTDDEKRAMLDSARAAYDERVANAPPPAPRSGLGGLVMLPPAPPREFIGVDPEDMPDYYPPIRAGTVRADRDGNVWILPTTSLLAADGLVYDVVNRRGEVVERVVLPPGRNIAAFGPDGILYLQSSPNGTHARLERARVIR